MNHLEDRKFILLFIFLSMGLVFIIRLFYLQVVEEKYKDSAQNQTLSFAVQIPPRGLIYDRNGTLMVYNEVAYDLMATPRLVKNLDTTALASLIGLTEEDLKNRLKEARSYSLHKPSAIVKLFTKENYARITETLYKHEGFHIEKRLVRKYPHEAGAHVLGYIGEANAETISKDTYYRRGDYLGIGGIEKTYEKYLRGTKGVKVSMKDVHNVIKGSYKDGTLDTIAIQGKNLTSSLDIELQLYGEKLMHNKKGSIVAIEPATGEILALVSSPTYNPNLLVGNERSDNYNALQNNDSLKPLFNRALMAMYPPGSIFKIVQSLIALQEGAITPQTGFPCVKSLVGCHNHPPASDIIKAIQFSCNPYYYNVFKRIIQPGKQSSIFLESEMGMEKWEQDVKRFGLGNPLPLDLGGMKSGSIPGPSFYNKLYGKGRWAFTTIYSLSIGQGEMLVVPIQMANLAAIIANKGYYYVPHAVKAIEEQDIDSSYTTKLDVEIDAKWFDYIHEGMENVVHAPHGTARRARIDGIVVCGKTGTAENPHGEDHSVFIAFAPKENPKIAIAVYVENAGFGGTWAAPIASLIMEKYLTGEIKDKEKEAIILEANLLNVVKKEK